MEMPDSEKAVEFTPDSDLRKDYFTHRTQYLMVRRHRSTGEILDVSHSNNVATASMWLRYENVPMVSWKDPITGEDRSEKSSNTVKDVFEISMDRGIRQVGAKT